LDWVAHVARKGGQWVAAAVLLLAAAIWLFWWHLHHRRDFKASITCRSKEKET
jgi:hypothetical protein